MTNKIKTINPQVCKELRVIIDKKLNSLEKEYGIKFHVGNASYDDDSIKFSFKVTLENAKNEFEKSLERNLQYRNQFENEIKLDPNKIVNFGKFKATLVGYKPKARTKPYIIKNVESEDKYVISNECCEKHFGISNN